MKVVEDDVLVRITAAVAERLAAEPAAPDLERRAREAAGTRRRTGRRSLVEALRSPGVRVIAECKRRSPSAGELRPGFDALALAIGYERAGAAAISVVTEPRFFAGQAAWLPPLRAAVALPVLQKDFLIAPRQLYEAVLLGADAVLLIARVLPGAQLAEMVSHAGELGLDVLLEVHDAGELERAVETDARIIGVNARDLRTFRVDLESAAALAARVPADRVAVVESGVHGAADVRRLLAGGVRRLLVGEHLLRAADPEAALAELVACR